MVRHSRIFKAEVSGIGYQESLMFYYLVSYGKEMEIFLFDLLFS